jgi:F420-0:gamma-glutamyl ligase-like protein
MSINLNCSCYCLFVVCYCWRHQILAFYSTYDSSTPSNIDTSAADKGVREVRKRFGTDLTQLICDIHDQFETTSQCSAVDNVAVHVILSILSRML